MPKLTLGNISGGGEPAKAKMRMFRYGLRHLGSYEYDTLDLRKLGGHEEPVHIEVDELERFFDRAQKGKPGATYTDPRMTTGAVAFMLMENDVTDDGDFTQRYFRKDAAEPTVDHIEDGYRTWGAQTAEQESIGLQFSLRQMDADTMAYMDNALFRTSNILWEFSPDGGRGKWYQLYDLPNRENTRITLPEPTNQIRLRAVSNNPEEWVQALAVTPKLDWQNRYAVPLYWDEGEIVLDDFGYLYWPRALGGMGDAVYVVYGEYTVTYEKGTEVTHTVIEEVPTEVTKEVERTETWEEVIDPGGRFVYDPYNRVCRHADFEGRGEDPQAYDGGIYLVFFFDESETPLDQYVELVADIPFDKANVFVGGGHGGDYQQYESGKWSYYFETEKTGNPSRYVSVVVTFETLHDLDEFKQRMAETDTVAVNFYHYTEPIVEEHTRTYTETVTETIMVEVEKEVTEVVTETYTETYTGEIARTKRNSLAPDEWRAPEEEGAYIIVAAYDAASDPIYISTDGRPIPHIDPYEPGWHVPTTPTIDDVTLGDEFGFPEGEPQAAETYDTSTDPWTTLYCACYRSKVYEDGLLYCAITHVDCRQVDISFGGGQSHIAKNDDGFYPCEYASVASTGEWTGIVAVDVIFDTEAARDAFMADPQIEVRRYYLYDSEQGL